MKIKKLVVKNYKVFDHLELDFTDKNGQVLDTIVLAGLNGSGKTTVLETIKKFYDYTIFSSYKNLDNGFIEIEFELTEEEKERGQKWLLNFVTNEKMDADAFNFIEQVSPSEKYIKYRIDANWSKKSQNTIFLMEGFFVSIVNSNKEQETKLLYLPTNHIEDEGNEDLKNSNLMTIHLRSSKEQMKKLAMKSIRDEIFKNEDIAPRQSKLKAIQQITNALVGIDLKTKLVDLDSEELIFQSANGKKIKFEELSSGEQNLYFRAIFLSKLNPKDSIIMVDEPEDALHPTWQQKVIKLYQNIGENNQVIFATHSPQIIASVHPESLFVLAINDETHRVEAINMADEHKYTYGVDPNRILSEIMGTPIRDFETQQRIKVISDLIKHVEFNLSVSGVSQVEKEINLLAEDLGKQDASIMRFRNEILLLKRKLLVAQ